MIVLIGLENRIEESISFKQNSGGRAVLIQMKKQTNKNPVSALLHNENFCVFGCRTGKIIQCYVSMLPQAFIVHNECFSLRSRLSFINNDMKVSLT